MTVPLPQEYLEELLAGYVLGDLSLEETENLQQLLVEDPDLEAEIQSLQEILATLPYTLPTRELNPQVRQNILDRISPLPTPSLSPLAADPLPPQNIPQFSKPSTSRILRTWRNLSVSWTASWTAIPWMRVAGGIATLLVAALSIRTYQLQQQLVAMQRQIDRQEDVIAMLQQPNTRLVSLKGMDGAVTASGSMVMTPGDPQVVLILQNLPPLPEGQAYQLWSVINDQKIPWEQFRVNEQGTAFTKLSLPSSYPSSYIITRLVVTIEVSPTPPIPTGPMVMISDL